MEPILETRESLVRSWNYLLTESISLDSWGQVIEASHGYKMLSCSISEAISYSGQFSYGEKKELDRSRDIIQERSRLLECTDLTTNSSENLDRIKSVIPVFEQLKFDQQTSDNNQSNEFLQEDTINQSKPSTFLQHTLKSQNKDLILNEDKTQIRQHILYNKEGLNSLLPGPTPEPGMSYLSVTIEQIGLKNAKSLTDPYFLISVKDRLGQDLSIPQSTPITHNTDMFTLLFNQTVHIQSSIQALDKEGGIYFILQHFKPKRHKISTKCFSILERDEIEEGAVALEIYKKPVEYKKKKLSLLSAKPLYLHLTLHITQH